MAIEILKPNTIHLAGDIVLVNDKAAGEEITPGALVNRVAGEYVNHASSGAYTQPAFALEQDEMNLGVDHPYQDGYLIKVGIGRPGATFWALLASGQNIADGAVLYSNGAGAFTGSGTTPIVKAVESVNNTNGQSPRIRVEVI